MHNEHKADMYSAALASLEAAADILMDLGEEELSLKIRNQATNVAILHERAVKAAHVPTVPAAGPE